MSTSSFYGDNPLYPNGSNVSQTAFDAAASAANSAAVATSASNSVHTDKLLIDSRWLGTYATRPTVDASGNPIVGNSLGYNTTTSRFEAFDGLAWRGLASILQSNGTPGSSIGVEGDTAIDLTTGLLYAKVGGAWFAGISLKGPTGAQILSGSGDPASGTGVTGDYWFDTTNLLFYGPKAATGWSGAASLAGPVGPTGPTGPIGNTGPTGPSAPTNRSMVFIDDYGADPTGAVASDAALTAAKAALNPGATLVFGCGSYKFANAITFNDLNITVTGQGVSSTVIHFTSAVSGQAGFKFTYASDPTKNGCLRDMRIVTDVDQVNGNYAVSLSRTGNLGQSKGFLFFNLDIRGNNDGFWWYKGIDVSNAYFTSFDHVHVSGKFMSVGTVAIVGGTNNTSVAIDLRNTSTDSKFNDCRVYFVDVAFRMSEDTEGCGFINSTVVRGNTGWLCVGPTTVMWLFGCHANTWYKGVDIRNCSSVQIIGNSFYKWTESNADWIGVHVSEVSNAGSGLGQIHSNQFYGFQSQVPGGLSTAVVVSPYSAYTNVCYNLMSDISYGIDFSSSSTKSTFAFNNAIGGITVSWVRNMNADNDVRSNTPALVGTETAMVTIPASATTINVGGTNSKMFKTNNAYATNVSSFSGAYPGYEFFVVAGDANTTLVNGSTILLKGNTNFSMPANAMIKLVYDGTAAREIGRFP